MPVEKSDIYELLWSFAYLSVHRYGGNPIGEVLLVLTIMLLDEAGQNVTMSELADVTGLPKSNVSRYVSDQLRIGHLSEQIDPGDRRRRVLNPTDAGRQEQEWLRRRLVQLSRMKQASPGDEGRDVDMLGLLTRLTRRLREDESTRTGVG